MNIVLVGETGSGKTEICNWLTENLRYDKIVSYTTRKPRRNEINGIDYHFVDKNYFEEHEMALVTENMEDQYGVDANFENDDEKVLIVDPNGLQEIYRRWNKFKYISFYINASTEDRRKRCYIRGDSPMITIARMEKEKELFSDFNVDYIIDNSDGMLNCAILTILGKVKEACDCSPQDSTR